MTTQNENIRDKRITLKHGLTTLELLLNAEITIGKLLSYKQIQERLYYDYHHVRVLRTDGVELDFETFIGGEDVRLVLETARNLKAAVNRRKLVRELRQEGYNLHLKRHGMISSLQPTAFRFRFQGIPIFPTEQQTQS